MIIELNNNIKLLDWQPDEISNLAGGISINRPVENDDQQMVLIFYSSINNYYVTYFYGEKLAFARSVLVKYRKLNKLQTNDIDQMKDHVDKILLKVKMASIFE